MFGVTEPGCFGLVEVHSGITTLFVPRLPEEYSVWMGKLLTCTDFKKKYQVDHVFYADEVRKTFYSKMHEKFSSTKSVMKIFFMCQKFLSEIKSSEIFLELISIYVTLAGTKPALDRF